MLIKIVTKSRINSYTLNCQTGPYQPKCKIMFDKNCPKRTLLEGLCKFKAKDMRRRRRKRRIGTDSSLDLTPSTKLYIPSNIKKHVLLLSLGRLGCQGSNENFNTFAKVSVLEWPALWRITMNSLHNEGIYK